MYCPRCGAENPDVARFCGSCSAPLPGGQAPAQPQAPTHPPSGYVPQGAVPSGMKWGIGIAAVLVPLLGLIMGIIYMVDQNPEKKAAGKIWLMCAVGGMLMYCFFGALGNLATHGF